METLSEQEKQILGTILKAIPNMSEFERGYLLGVAESKANCRIQDSEDGSIRQILGCPVSF